MIRRFAATVLLALALPAAAQSVPAANYSDIWFLPTENGWGVSFNQHTGTNQVFAVWYTYDPRESDAAVPSNSRPMWVAMSGGTWTSPTSITGAVYILNGVPFFQSGSNRVQTQIGSVTFNFTSASTGTFTYNIAPPAGLSPGDPAFGLPAVTATKNITRLSF
jgi:hypothetical protein